MPEVQLAHELCKVIVQTRGGARKKRIFRRGEPMGEVEPGGAFLQRGERRQAGGCIGTDAVVRVFVVRAFDEDERLARLRQRVERKFNGLTFRPEGHANHVFGWRPGKIDFGERLRIVF